MIDIFAEMRGKTTFCVLKIVETQYVVVTTTISKKNWNEREVSENVLTWMESRFGVLVFQGLC